jgi:hypothetical protein
MKTVQAESIYSKRVSIFALRKTALVGVGDTCYAARRSEFRKLFLQPLGGPPTAIVFKYGVHKTERGTMDAYCGGAYHTPESVKVGCMTFRGEDVNLLRSWALRKIRKA